jgi:hemolysin activation/secretion protein
VRGTDIERPLSADKGISGTLEVSTPEFTTGLRALAFVDAGWLGNNDATEAKPSSDRLASVGLGLRYITTRYTLTAEYGRIVLGSKVPLTLNSSAPQKGDEKVHLNLGVRF